MKKPQQPTLKPTLPPLGPPNYTGPTGDVTDPAVQAMVARLAEIRKGMK